LINTDLRSVFLACHYVIPHMIENGGGAIVSTGSTAAIAGNMGWSAYGPAKKAIENLMANIAYQYGKYNIRANTVRPGLIITPQNDANVSQVYRDIFLDEIEVNRVGCPRDIGYAMLYLCSDEAAFVTSQVLTVDGGMWEHAPQNSSLRKLAEQSSK
jgi:NAD(P)-dependent dehydrogenase (short-subunit alcohol dehydrogenase family)